MSDSQVKFKAGDKVVRVNGDWNNMVVGEVAEVISVIHYCNGESALGLSKYGYGHDPGSFKLSFTKSDLKDGMKVVYRDGCVRYVMGNTLLMYEGSAYGNKGKYSHATYTDDYDTDLKKSILFENMDIMKVIDRDNTVLFERVEAPAKSQQEIEMDKLQKQIAELQEQANKLKATMQ